MSEVAAAVAGVPALAVSFALGSLLGALSLLSLWLTLAGLPRARRPALRVLTGMLLRLLAIVGVFALLASHAGGGHAVAAAAGLVAARVPVLRWTRARIDASVPAA